MYQIVPCGHRVLIKQDVVLEKDEVYNRAKKSGIIVAKNDDLRREQMGVDSGVVLDVGQTAFKDYGGDDWCKKGDRIAFAKHTGKVFRNPDNEDDIYIVLNDEDIIAILSKDD